MYNLIVHVLDEFGKIAEYEKSCLSREEAETELHKLREHALVKAYVITEVPHEN